MKGILNEVNLQASALNNDVSFLSHTFYVILVGALYVQVGIFLCNGCRKVYHSKCLKQNINTQQHNVRNIKIHNLSISVMPLYGKSAVLPKLKNL